MTYATHGLHICTFLYTFSKTQTQQGFQRFYLLTYGRAVRMSVFYNLLKILKNYIGSLTSRMQICTFLKGWTFARHGYFARSSANYSKWQLCGKTNPIKSFNSYGAIIINNLLNLYYIVTWSVDFLDCTICFFDQNLILQHFLDDQSIGYRHP